MCLQIYIYIFILILIYGHIYTHGGYKNVNIHFVINVKYEKRTYHYKYIHIQTFFEKNIDTHTSSYTQIIET